MTDTRVALCYGDSNTHGTAPLPDLLAMERYGPAVRWPGVMAAELGPEWRVIEEGLPGRTTVHPDPIAGIHKNGLGVLPAVLETHRPVDVVVLMLGTNDLKTRFAVPPVEIAVSIEKLVLAIRQSCCGPAQRAPAVLVVSPPPVLEAGCLAEIFEGGAAKSARLAVFVSAAAAQQGAAFLDAGRVIASSPIDGVHFDAGAHATLGRAVAKVVQSMAF